MVSSVAGHGFCVGFNDFVRGVAADGEGRQLGRGSNRRRKRKKLVVGVKKKSQW